MSDFTPKQLICICICESIFPLINQLCDGPTESYEGHPRFATSLYSKVRGLSVLGGGDVSNNREFMHALLSVWHRWRYNTPDWITFSDVVSEEEYQGTSYDVMEKKIANFSIVQAIKDESNIVWYSGKAWKDYRNKIGSNNIKDYKNAGLLLAQFWPWGDMLDHDNL